MLSQLTASSKRLALVGLAKNTGKTETLTVLLRELASPPGPKSRGGEQRGRRVGVTSVGRDGEERDVIDARIEKPRLHLPAGSLVASTDTLLRASGIAHELVDDPGIRTPLGRILVARLSDAGAIEVAGPSAAADVRAVSDTMLASGAEQVLIDGAIDRRAASSPDVADGLILATGAVLDHDIGAVVQRTRDAVELVRVPLIEDTTDSGRRLRELARTGRDDADDTRADLLVGEDLQPVMLPPCFLLTSEAEQIAQLLDQHPSARWLLVAGALPERFLHGLIHPLHRRGRELVLVVADPTRVFLTQHGPGWYRRQGVHLQALNRIPLQAITVNPVAPQSHRFNSAQLRSLLEMEITDVPIFDVLDAGYGAVSSSELASAAGDNQHLTS
jgi:hypothetical protein